MATNPDSFFAGSILDEDTGKALKYWHLIKMEKNKAIWAKSFFNKIVGLSQGILYIKGTNKIKFIRCH